METFTPIAMKCTQEQFNAVKPKLKGLKIECIGSFYDYNYLTNNYGENSKVISNVRRGSMFNDNREIHVYWNEEIFLKACGIEIEQSDNFKETLEKRLQKAEEEVKRLQEAIEGIKIKSGDWVYIYKEKCIFKITDNDINYLDDRHKKIQDPELISKLNELNA